MRPIDLSDTLPPGFPSLAVPWGLGGALDEQSMPSITYNGVPASALTICRSHVFLTALDFPAVTRVLQLNTNESPILEGTRVWDHHICFLQALKTSE